MSTTSSELAQTVTELLAAPRGILAADESIKTMSGRLEKLGIDPEQGVAGGLPRTSWPRRRGSAATSAG